MGVDRGSMSQPSTAQAGRALGQPPPPRREKQVEPEPDLEALGLADAGDDATTLQRKSEALLAAGAKLRKAAAEQRTGRMQTALRVTPTQKRDPEMEKDPTVYWTGTHYQQIAQGIGG